MALEPPPLFSKSLGRRIARIAGTIVRGMRTARSLTAVPGTNADPEAVSLGSNVTFLRMIARSRLPGNLRAASPLEKSGGGSRGQRRNDSLLPETFRRSVGCGMIAGQIHH